MKKIIKKSLIVLLAMSLYVTPAYATEDKEIVDINDTETIQEILSQQPQEELEIFTTDTSVQRDERITYEGYALPEVVNHNIEEMDEEGLALLELLSMCGKTSEFHLTFNNSKNNTIPFNYINMLSMNYTPFTFYFVEDGVNIASIYTNGVTATSGNFPAHMHLAQGVDFIQLSFENADAQIEGNFKATFNCYSFIGYPYEVYEGDTVVNSGKVDDSGYITLYLSNFNTKTVKFKTSQSDDIPATEKPQAEDVTADTSVPTENNTPVLPIALGIAGALGIIVCVTVIFVLNKKVK